MSGFRRIWTPKSDPGFAASCDCRYNGTSIGKRLEVHSKTTVIVLHLKVG